VGEITIRPTLKFIKAGAIALLALVLGADIAYFTWMRNSGDFGWLPLLSPVVLIWPGVRWLRYRLTKAVIAGDRLRYETGLASKSTRNIQLSKVQDVRVDQSVTQRMFGVGDISIETAGETSRLTIRNIDRPQTVADEIMTASQKGPTAA
jgi:uncharacterized membrane protein YdbT with pleckstrin-like domain